MVASLSIRSKSLKPMDLARTTSMDISPVARTTRSLSSAIQRTHFGGLSANALEAITAARLVGTIRMPVSASAELIWTVGEDIQKYTDSILGARSII
jgi:hypothetical protein